jgi:hypothetical protein
MFVPVVLGSDKTTVSVATGHNEYYPLYASVGNLHSDARRAHHNSVSIIGSWQYQNVSDSFYLFITVF